MFHHKTFIAGGQVASVTVSSETKAFFSVVEGNVKDGSSRDYLDGILLTALSEVSEMEHEGSPEIFAGTVSNVLKAKALAGEVPDAVFFAGLLMTRQAVSVCTAGDIRIHLLQRGDLLEVTRDHTILSDPVAGVTERLSAEQREVHVGIPTRWLGPTADRPPESVRWAVSGQYQVLVSTSLVHRYRDPRDYIKILEDDSVCEEIVRVYPGLIASLSVR